MINKKIILCVVIISIISCFFQTVSGAITGINELNNESMDDQINLLFKDSELDIQYIYNITKALSYIIFTEYNESAGEIAKGRAYGTKGEHKAAQILFENMTKLGLNTTMERLNNIPSNPDLIHAYNVLDYNLTLRNKSNGYNETVDCYISPIKLDPPFVHEKIFNFSYQGLKIKRWPKNLLEWIKAFAYDKKGEEYIFLIDVEGGLSRNPNPNPNLAPDFKLMRKFFYPIRYIPSIGYTYLRRYLLQAFINNFFPNCIGRLSYDFTNDTYDTACNKGGAKPANINMNGTICNKINADIDNYTIDFNVKEMYNTSVISYNVIGTLNGTDPNKTVIVDCLYDSVICQGTGDAALGMGIVMGIAKYFTDNKIVPKCSIKFIGFGGEEAGCLGAIYYEATHKDENITHVIDMNQVCSAQDYPRLTLNVIFNSLGFMNEIWPIVEKTNYTERVGNTDITKRWWPEGAPSDDSIFAQRRPFEVKTVCFLEDFPWIAHHRDGLNHWAGDVLDNIDWNEVCVTSEMVLNITKHVACVPNIQLKK